MSYQGEVHRLVTLAPDFQSKENLKQFNQFYESTKGLRIRLAFQIDARRLGVTPDIVLSWFDDKFIFVYNKYYQTESKRLKGYIIQALQMFKNRILRKAYQESIYHDMVTLEGEYDIINMIPNEEAEEDEQLGKVKRVIKTKLSEDAYLVFTIELNPPPYILSKMKNPNSNIPTKLLAEYLELGYSKGSINYINQLRKEISIATGETKEHFQLHYS